jgi:LCP family protein required for cell wall assembly
MSVVSEKKIEQQNNSSTDKLKPKPAVLEKTKIFSFKVTFMLFVIFIFSLIFFVTNKKIDGLFIKNNLDLLSDFILAPEDKIKSFDDKINILILGKSGEGHIAPDLTDTIILSSISLKNSSIRIISLPRDIWIPEIRAKLNSAYYWGKERDGNGIILSQELVEKITGEKLSYTVVFDFSSFTKIVDVLGGIEVDVENSFTDEKYPIYGKENDLCDGDRTYKCRYETISFEKGKQNMNGEIALKFVRSRNAEGDEGTDIAREKRQQKIIFAVKSALLDPKNFLNPKKIWGIWKILKISVETNIDESSGVVVARKIFDSRKDIGSSVIPEDYLINPAISSKYDNQYVFIPKDNSWNEIKSWIKDFLN